LLALNYPKRIADAVLARTDFAKLFRMIPRYEQKAFIAAPQTWVKFVLATVPNHVGAKDSVIERGIQVREDDPASGIVKPNLTVENWLLGMVPDKLPPAPGNMEKALGLPEKAPEAAPKSEDRLKALPDAESMGGLGNKTEEVGSGPFKSQAGIFEFRGAQSVKIPLDRWRPFAIEFQKYISSVHD
jgi:hypothetical protein